VLSTPVGLKGLVMTAWALAYSRPLSTVGFS
jgi:hypothetical protein